MLCHTTFHPTALPVGVSRLMLPCGGIRPLTCTIFDPTYFGSILENHVFHISPTRLKSSIMGKHYLDFALKIAYRGVTGARESCLVCLDSKFVHYYRFLLFWLLGIKPISLGLVVQIKNLLQNKNSTCNLFCSELTSHTNEGDFFCFVSCVLQEVSISMKVSGVPLRNTLCLTRSG